jgi:hypothetical protein
MLANPLPKADKISGYDRLSGSKCRLLVWIQPTVAWLLNTM